MKNYIIITTAQKKEKTKTKTDVEPESVDTYKFTSQKFKSFSPNDATWRHSSESTLLETMRICHPWWRHQMDTFSALLALCAGNSPVSGEFTAQRPVTRSFDVFFDLRLIKWLSKHSRGWWFETLSRPLWRHCNAMGFCGSHLRLYHWTWPKRNI